MQSLSDDELLSLLEQVQNNRFPALSAPLARAVPPEQEKPADSKSLLSTADPGARQNGRSALQTPAESAQQSSIPQPGILRQAPNMPPEAATAARHSSPLEPTSKPTQPVAPAEQADPSASGNTVDTWKYRLQAFAKPLMQQVQGTCPLCVSPLGVDPSHACSKHAGIWPLDD